MKPLLLGYQMVRLDTTREELKAGREALEAFADREGYALGEIFVEHDQNRPSSALAALIAVAKYAEIKAIAVPRASDLGRLPRVQQMTRQRLELETQVHVHILNP